MEVEVEVEEIECYNNCENFVRANTLGGTQRIPDMAEGISLALDIARLSYLWGDNLRLRGDRPLTQPLSAALRLALG